MPLTEIKAGIPAAAAEDVNAVLLDLGLARWTLLEDAIARRAWIVGIFPDRAGARAAWLQLRPLLPVPPLADPVLRTLRHRDWRDSYKSHFKASRFGRLHWVPVWEKPRFRRPAGHVVLWLDPGMAFGTGNHETTRLCCRRLVALAERGPPARRRVIDAGCGSGILALSAARLGFGEVTGFDLDPEAVRVSRANAGRNRLTGRAHFFAGDLGRGLAHRQADIVLANIQADVLVAGKRALLRAVAPGGTLALSGILVAERAAVRAAFASAAPGWRIASAVLGEWCDLALTRPGRAC